MDATPQDDKPSPRADLWAGVFWILFGLAIVWGSWAMDRLAHLQVTIYTIPGLLPGILGASIAFMGVILASRAIRAGALALRQRRSFIPSQHWRLAVSLGWSLIYAGALIKSLLPFWLATAIYIAVFVVIFQYEERRAKGQLARGILIAVVHGLLSGLIIQYVFEDLFLVRLP